MDIIKEYFLNLLSSIRTNDQSMDTFKIISVNNKNLDDIFLLYDANNLKLTSQSLMKLLLLKRSDRNILEELLMDNSSYMKDIYNQTVQASVMLYEDRIFFNFDPYGNFLLDNNSTNKDVIDIIRKTTSYYQSNSSNTCAIDFADKVNPYGLEKVVFTGGGSKGAVYIGTVIGLLAVGQIFYLNHFSGTSVGALTAMVVGCMTPSKSDYTRIKEKSLKKILAEEKIVVDNYRKASKFIVEKFYSHGMENFYAPPTYTFYGMWTMLDRIVKDNGLYDPEKSGFQIWYALVCKHIAEIMGNGLDKLIIVKRKDGTYVDTYDKSEVIINDNGENITKDTRIGWDEDINWPTEKFDGWVLERFFTFEEFYHCTDKTLVLTGTNTNGIKTVYYTHTDPEYKNLSVMKAGQASMSIPWVMKPPVINNSYNLDGGLFDNYPITHCDIKRKDKILKYDNSIFGYLIDDKSTIIDAYEIIRELWLVYNGFMDSMNISYLIPKNNLITEDMYLEITDLFFEIRQEIYKMLYFTNVDLNSFLKDQYNSDDMLDKNISKIINDLDQSNELNEMVSSSYSENEFHKGNKVDIDQLNNIINEINEQAKCDLTVSRFKLPQKGIDYLKSNLHKLDSHYKNFDSLYRIGRKTDLADVMELSIRHGEAYNALMPYIKHDIDIIEKLELKGELIVRYEMLLKYMMTNILVYYELKGTFILDNDFEAPSDDFINIIFNLNKKLTKFDELTVKASEKLITKNYIKTTVDIALSALSKVMTRATYKDVDLNNSNLDKSSYSKVVDFFFHTDMSGMMYKYGCIVNDRNCNDTFNNMRTIKISAFETSMMHFNMDVDLKARLIYEGYSKTIKYFTSLLHIMEITGRTRSNAKYIESYETRFKKMI